VKSISAAELEGRLGSGEAPFLLDVREPEELADGAIAGSINIPMGELAGRLDEIPRDRDVVAICHLGQRSAYVVSRLNALGYERAMNLTGGTEEWLRFRRPNLGRD
jgi:rhodanese-related sulfurtransferase